VGVAIADKGVIALKIIPLNRTAEMIFCQLCLDITFSYFLHNFFENLFENNRKKNIFWEGNNLKNILKAFLRTTSLFCL